MTDHSIQLKKYHPDDFADYMLMVSDYNVMQYITERALSEKEARQKFDEILEINAMQGSLGYFRASLSDGQYIGDCKLERYSKDDRQLEIGYIIKEAFWGKGLATKLCAMMLDLAHDIAPNDHIIGIIDPANSASKHILEKFGFISFFVGMEDDLPTEKLILEKQ
ncbi:GNAT family N-acetyltransferase [Sphingobacterium corticis]|uniref:GNAT family N-acetyltransferase n=1 Tax=Sphingobacterium corticis TaxID=1812823 RepID=A0ABW5NNL0_9SPHI